MEKKKKLRVNLKGLTPKIIGQVGVDAGLIWIGDPCYILHQKPLPKSLGKNWGEFCDSINEVIYKSFNFDMGHEGVGVVTSTKYGDGCYNVIGFFEENSDRPSCVLVDFTGVFKF